MIIALVIPDVETVSASREQKKKKTLKASPGEDVTPPNLTWTRFFPLVGFLFKG